MSNLSLRLKLALFGLHVLLYPVAAIMALFGFGMCLSIGWEGSQCSDFEAHIATYLASAAVILAFANAAWSLYWFVVALKWVVNRVFFGDSDERRLQMKN